MPVELEPADGWISQGGSWDSSRQGWWGLMGFFPLRMAHSGRWEDRDEEWRELLRFLDMFSYVRVQAFSFLQDWVPAGGDKVCPLKLLLRNYSRELEELPQGCTLFPCAEKCFVSPNNLSHLPFVLCPTTGSGEECLGIEARGFKSSSLWLPDPYENCGAPASLVSKR